MSLPERDPNLDNMQPGFRKLVRECRLERDREKTLSAATMESDCPAAPDLPLPTRLTDAKYEEAAEEYMRDWHNLDSREYVLMRKAFLAGANWRAVQ